MGAKRNIELPRTANRKKEEYKYFVGTTLKNPLDYAVGERIVFKIRPKFMDGYLDIPYIWYSLVAEHGEMKDGYLGKSEDGWFYVESSLSENGFVYLTARACDENKRVIEDIEAFNGSAGADVNLIRRATRTPRDYTEFWRSLEKAVEQTDKEILFSEWIDDPENPDFIAYNMRIKAPGSEYASFSVAYPRDAKPGELKLAMLFQGYGVRSAPPHLLDGYLTVHVNAHPIPNGQSEEFYEELSRGILKDYGYDEKENERPETTYFAKMLLRDLAVLYFIKDHELLNKKDYVFVGSSQGGMQACNMAAHFDRASALLMVVPWLSDVYGHELGGRRENTMPKGEGIIYFDTAVAAELLKCPVYMISGLGDIVCNSSTQMALYNSIDARKYCEFYQNRTHSLRVPWDNNVSMLGDDGLVEAFKEHLGEYYNWN